MDLDAETQTELNHHLAPCGRGTGETRSSPAAVGVLPRQPKPLPPFLLLRAGRAVPHTFIPHCSPIWHFFPFLQSVSTEVPPDPVEREA